MQFLQDNFSQILTFLFGSGSFLAFLAERKKRKIEEGQLATDALKTMQDAYDKFTEDSLKRYKELSVELEILKKKLLDMSSQLLIERENYNKLKDSYDKLKAEFEDYKLKHEKIVKKSKT